MTLDLKATIDEDEEAAEWSLPLDHHQHWRSFHHPPADHHHHGRSFHCCPPSLACLESELHGQILELVQAIWVRLGPSAVHVCCYCPPFLLQSHCGRRVRV
uniref:Uncharacterized protein n=2 Tax=Opuntia streptacantha TaxID=393608 RepID=A0A7C9CXR0_OPUST